MRIRVKNSIMQPFRNEESSFQFSSYCVSLYNNIIYINSDRKLRYVRNFTTVRDRVPVFAEFFNFTHKNKIGFLTAKENPSLCDKRYIKLQFWQFTKASKKCF